MKHTSLVNFGAAIACAMFAASHACASTWVLSDSVATGERVGAGYAREGGEALVRIFAESETEIPQKMGTDPVSEVKVFEKKLGDQERAEVSFDTGKMVAGRVRFRAEAYADDGSLISRETSPWTAVSARRNSSLSGEWQIASVEPFPVNRDGSVPNIDKAQLPETVLFPSKKIADFGLPRDFRGWVTLKRTIDLPGDAAAPLFFSAKGVADSAALRVNGADIAEMLPEDELDSSLSHWSYFHAERIYQGIQNREDSRRLARLLWDRDVDPNGLQTVVPPVSGGKAEIELTIRATSGLMQQQPPYGVHGGITLAALPQTYVEGAEFDTSKSGDLRRFTFSVRLANAGSKPFKGRLRAVYGQYAGETPYTGACPAIDDSVQDVVIPPGGCTVEVIRDEVPRFATCRASFVLQDGSKAIDVMSLDYHTVVVEIRDRRDMYVNNERFFAKGRCSSSGSPNMAWQFRANGTNMRRGMDSWDWPEYPGLRSRAAFANGQLPQGILFDTGPILASCEKCTFWNPEDTSNVEHAVRYQIRMLKDCPGIIQWEATNELFGEPEEARVLICDLFRKLDPYHRPVVMTKGGGEWESLAEDGTVSGPDIVGIQYLGSREAIDTLTATITEKPIQSTEINWNDPVLTRDGLWRYGLDRGVCGMLLFDYSGNSTDQAVTAHPTNQLLPDEWNIVARINREMYLDIEATAMRRSDGKIVARFANRMPYTLRDVELSVRYGGRTVLPELAPGDACEIVVPGNIATPINGEPNPRLVAYAKYTTHGGFKTECAMSAEVSSERR